MKRTPLLITLVIIVVVAGSIWLYQASTKESITPWDLIGNDATLVFELNSIDAFKQKPENIQPLKKIVGSSNSLFYAMTMKSGNGGKIYISLHPISNDDFGFVIYTQIKPGSSEELVASQKDLVTKKRLYNGVEINEAQQGKALVSFAVIDDILLISSSSFLLEGALRLRTSESSELFKNTNAPLYRLPTLQSDEGNVYLSVSNLSESINLFLQPSGSKNKFPLLGSALADIKAGEDRMLMNGFVLDSEQSILNLFKNQEPQSIDLTGLVSNRVAILSHYGISKPNEWFEQQQKFLQQTGINATDSLETEMSKLSVKVESIRGAIGNELATCYISTKGSVLNIIKLNQEKGQVSIFDELTSKIATQKKDSIYIESYAGYQIKLIDYRNFLHQLFYPLMQPSEQSYFVQIGSHMIMSENVELIKLFIDDMDNENTWGKSVEWNKFFSSSLQESNVDLFFDGKLTSVYLRDLLNSKWNVFFDSTSFLGISKGAVQLSRLESNFYLNASLQFSEREERKVNNNLIKITYDFGNNIIGPVKIVKSHISKVHEIMMQDSAQNLYLLSRDLKIRWKQPIKDRITDDIEQIDFFANGKLQYFFTTKKSIYLIDRLGRNVDEFPKELKSDIIEYSTVVDYDRSKKYRYLMTDVKGNLLLTDKNGVLLEGWDPRLLTGKMIKSSGHNRILGKDYFIAIQQNGIVNLLNRRGEMSRGFPLDLGFRPSGDFFITLGNTLPSTYFNVVSSDGTHVQFGLDGQIRKREVLIKRTASTQFSIVKSMAGNNYVFLRLDVGKLAVMDSDGKLIFEIENPGSLNWELSYLENRLKKRYYCLYDKQQNFSYYYSSDGQLLLSQPLESTQLPTMYFDEKFRTLSIYNVFNSKLDFLSIKS